MRRRREAGNTPSPTTGALLALLARWPRRVVSAALLAREDPLEYLESGALAADLQHLPGGQRQPGMRAGWSSQIGYFDPGYPAPLREIPDPPLVLYYLGNLSVLYETSIAVVGARRCTSQGRINAQLLGRELASLGVTVVSGLALGIDGAAHKGALSAPGPGRTAAVLGSGLGQLYPKKHAAMARQMVAAGGLLVSEYADEVTPRPGQFPERNRIISGVSIATVVVEASDKSGSLITARLAAEQGRDVLAMPGSVTSAVSRGCHRLIQQGAGLVCSAEDVLQSAGLEHRPSRPPEEPLDIDSDPVRRRIIEHVQGYPIGFDELAVLTGLEAGELASALIALELAGIVQQGPLGYIRTS